MSPYYLDLFKKLQPDFDPRHIAAYMMLEYSGGWSNLPMSTFKREARISAGCIRVAGVEAAEQCAKSFGL